MTATTAVAAPARTHVRVGWLTSTALVWLVAIGFAAFCWFGVHAGVHGLDAKAYWLAAHRSDPYHAAPGTLGAYLYPPPFALAIWPLARLPLGLFVDTWMLLEAVTFAWLLRPLGVRWGVPAFLMCFAELIVGNIHAFLALAMVLGVRRGAPWALAVLTKLTTGVGLVMFAVRREWRPVAVALGTSAALAALSALVVPGQWVLWWRFTMRHSGEGQLFFPARLAAAVVIAGAAGRLRKPWLLPFALVLAQPVAEWMSLTLLSAIPRLHKRSQAVAA